MGIFLFVTANEHERVAFEAKFICSDIKYILGKTYYLGMFGCYTAAYIHIDEQGVTSPASAPLIGILMNELHPVAVVMVGIAFGVDEHTQKIGDVLVSDKILPYDSQRLIEDKTEYKEIPKEVGFQLLNAFRETRKWNYLLPDSKHSVVYIGSMLTGSKLINHYKYRTQLINDFADSKPIGGEMEAQGIYSVSRLYGVSEWIIVKGICDWGYKKDNPNKENDQEIAANAAVDYCFHVFSRSGVFEQLVHQDKTTNHASKVLMQTSNNGTIQEEKRKPAFTVRDMINSRNELLQHNLVSWIEMLPSVEACFETWLRKLLFKTNNEILVAFSLYLPKRELDSIITAISSRGYFFIPMQQAIVDRFHHFLGGVHGITENPNVISELSSKKEFIGSLRKMITNYSGVNHRIVRNVTLTCQLIQKGELFKLRASAEDDFELWYVLKSIQEYGDCSNQQDLNILLDYVADIIHSEITLTGSRISDRRYSWWAIRTLVGNSDKFPQYIPLIENYTSRLLSDKVKSANYEEARRKSVLPDNIEKQISLWELVNIMEVLDQYNVELVYSDDTIQMMTEKKNILINEMLNSSIPRNMRLATIELRVCLTFLGLQATGLWGKNI